MRTTRETVTFDLPFSLGGAEKQYPAGTYTIETDEELVEGLPAGRHHHLPPALAQRGGVYAGRFDQPSRTGRRATRLRLPCLVRRGALCAWTFLCGMLGAKKLSNPHSG